MYTLSSRGRHPASVLNALWDGPAVVHSITKFFKWLSFLFSEVSSVACISIIILCVCVCVCVCVQLLAIGIMYCSTAVSILYRSCCVYVRMYVCNIMHNMSMCVLGYNTCRTCETVAHKNTFLY